ncbi:MAG: hypothetical protein JWM18_3793 [Chloroflexi bacterium]|jgi:hypothetical protein|nr:hypothetical protein [Chloroflexota bacterium]
MKVWHDEHNHDRERGDDRHDRDHRHDGGDDDDR